MPDINTPPTVTNPDNPTLPADWEQYVPDPALTVIDDLQLNIAPKLAAGTATPAMRRYYQANKPAHWSNWDAPAADQPKDETKPAQQQQQTAPGGFDVAAFDADALAVASDEAADKIVVDIAALADTIDAAGHAAFESEKRRLIDSGVGVDEANTIAKKLADQTASDERKKVYEQHEKRLLTAIQKLQEQEQQAAKYAQTFNCVDRPTPVTLLTLHDLGSERRSRIADQLRGAGPGALRAAAEFAKSTSDATLASAVFIVNGALPKEQRLFSNDDLAARFYSEKAQQLHRAYVTARAAVQSAVASLRSLKSGNPDSLGKINRGIARMRVGNTAPAENDLQSRLGDNHSISKISRGLKALAAESGDGE